eukprot:CAMPEP_0197395058 /NCGR_PEP_ID=MMETSP1165-20131217/6313_1 /TAXON_ID=284809 /ORGANISM="Chrysocystis fragilis, Strain CCMP3189" /LENGTH=94 /DNA_ID=CAMNT_0042920805 /DNA_START=45 /DNA_END=328 /DNA_ORIENTATION=-
MTTGGSGAAYAGVSNTPFAWPRGSRAQTQLASSVVQRREGSSSAWMCDGSRAALPLAADVACRVKLAKSDPRGFDEGLRKYGEDFERLTFMRLE